LDEHPADGEPLKAEDLANEPRAVNLRPRRQHQGRWGATTVLAGLRDLFHMSHAVCPKLGSVRRITIISAAVAGGHKPRASVTPPKGPPRQFRGRRNVLDCESRVRRVATLQCRQSRCRAFRSVGRAAAVERKATRMSRLPLDPNPEFGPGNLPQSLG